MGEHYVQSKMHAAWPIAIQKRSNVALVQISHIAGLEQFACAAWSQTGTTTLDGNHAKKCLLNTQPQQQEGA